MRGQDRGQQHRNPAAKDQAQRNAQQRQRPDLQEIGQENHPPFRAQTAQGGNGCGFARQIGPHSGGYPHATHRQTGQAHQHQKRAQPFHKGGNARRTIARIPPAHPLVFKGLYRGVLGGLQIGFRW